MADHFDQLGATLMVGLGGSLDVYAGKVGRGRQPCSANWAWSGFTACLRQPSRLGRMMKLPRYVRWQSIRWRMKGEK